MKPSEFYEKYWLIDGKKPQPLTQKQKDDLDEIVSSPDNAYFMQIKRKTTGEIIDIDIEKLQAQMKNYPI